MIKQIILVLIILCSFSLFCDETWDCQGYWHSPDGWVIPDISKFDRKKVSKLEVKSVPAILQIEEYEVKQNINYSLFDLVRTDLFTVNLNEMQRKQISGIQIVKYKGKILMYVLFSFYQDKSVQNSKGELLFTTAAGAMEIELLADLNGDGKFEANYDGMDVVSLGHTVSVKKLAECILSHKK